MAVTDHYDFWYLDPDEEISDFPSTWNFNIDDIDAAIHEAATNNVAVSRVPKLPASQIDSGKFAQARIPNLPASQTTTGTFADARIPDTIARTADVDDETAALKKRIEELENANRSTGQRDISELLQDVTGSAYIFRKGDSVYIDLQEVIPKDSLKSGARFIQNLPTGFRPTIRRNFALPKSLNVAGWKSAYMLPDGGIGCWSANTDDKYYWSFAYITVDDWPSTLPGDPA